MIVGVLATYPARADTLRAAVDSVAPQLDRLTLVLNDHAAVPDWVAGHPNVVPVIPEADTKDTGKFIGIPEGAEWLFTLDDDIVYPPDYVARTLAGIGRAVAALGGARVMGGYHGLTYRRARFLGARWLRRLIGYNPHYIANSADTRDFRRALSRACIVENLGTGVAALRAEDAPPFAAVRDAQRYIDVRLASWCHANGIVQVCLPRPDGWLRDAHSGEQAESIFADFTPGAPAHVADEIWRFAFRNPRRGEVLDFGFADMGLPA